MEDEVERIQSSILGDLDDTIFHRVSEVTHDLLTVRKNVLADRAVLQELALRRSRFVNPSTQPYLSNMVGTLERLGNDLSTEREILAEALNLYLSMVSHRTNRIVNRLTVLSAIFLPLTFLCGVYGMNFRILPRARVAIWLPVFLAACSGDHGRPLGVHQGQSLAVMGHSADRHNLLLSRRGVTG